MLNKEKMKIGIIGCGSIFTHYVDIIKNQVPNISIVGVCDVNEKKQEIVAQLTNAKFYTNIKEMLNEKNIDACFILTPSGTHYDNGKICLKEGIDTFIEKPITLKIDDAIELNKLAKKNKVSLGVVYQNRFNKPIQLVRQLVNNGLFGRRVLTNVNLFWSRKNEYYKGWRGTWALDGGVMAQQAIHHLDILQWLNSGVEKVYCMEKTLINNLEAEDTSIGNVLFKDGSLGAFQVTTAARPKDLEASITILGENGFIKIGGLAINKINDISINGLKNKGEDLICEHSESVEKGFGNGHIAYLKKVYDSFNSGKIVPPVSGEDAINSLTLLHALYLSSELDAPVKINNNIKSMRLGEF